MLGELGEWWKLIPVFAAMLIAIVLPGWLWLRSTVRSSVVGIAAAPAFSSGIITICSVLFPRAGVDWEPTKVLPVLGLTTLLGGVTWFFSHARRVTGGIPRSGSVIESIGPRRPIGPEQSRVRAATWAMIVIGFFIAALPMLLRADPADPAQQWDSTFHLNGVHSILSTKNASPFGGLQELYGGREVFYPTGWHAWVSIFVTSRTVIEVSNVSSLVLMAVWVIGATALVSVITTSRAAILAAPILAGTLLNMPADALTMYNQWPHAMGLAALPGLAAAAIVGGRRIRDDISKGWRAQRRHVGIVVFLAIGTLGVVGAHPSSAFTLVAMLAAPLLASLARLARKSASRGSLIPAVGWGLVMVAVVAIPLALLGSEKIQSMGNYPRSGISFAVALSHMFTPYPPFSQTSGLTMLTGVQLVLLIIGVLLMTGAGRALGVWWRGGSAEAVDREATESEDASVGGSLASAEAPAGGGASAGAEVPAGAESLPEVEAPAGAEGLPGGGASAGAEARVAVDDEDRTGPVIVDGAPTPAWPVVSYLIFCGLTFLAYAPDNPLREFLLAPWYLDARRIMGAHGLMMVPIMAVAFAWITERISILVAALSSFGRGKAGAPADIVDAEPTAKRNGAASAVEASARTRRGPAARWQINALVGLVLLVISGVGALDARLIATDYVYDARNLGKPGMADAAELAMLRRARLILPNDALVVGDPIAGAAYIEVISDKDTVFPQLTMANADAYSQGILSQHFNEIHTNPEVCDVVRDLGITYFYEDEDGMYYNFLRSSRSPGLYSVDTSTGFELVDEGGTAKIWRITACGEVEGGGDKG